jgi:hypothetical protein
VISQQYIDKFAAGNVCLGSISLGASRQQPQPSPLCSASRRRTVLLVRTPCDDHQAGIRQRPFAATWTRPKAPASPDVALFLAGGEELLRILVTGGPLVRGGGGMPQRIMVSSRPSPALRTTGAGQSGNRPGIGGRLPTLSLITLNRSRIAA